MMTGEVLSSKYWLLKDSCPELFGKSQLMLFPKIFPVFFVCVAVRNLE